MASARARPARICPAAVESVVETAVICPAMRSVTAPEAPLYGTCSRSIRASCLKSSATSCPWVPLPGEPYDSVPGNGPQGQLVAELFKQLARIDLLHVPYKGASGAVTDLMAGQITAVSTTLSTAAGQIRAGRARALAISAAQRLPDYPDVPTFAEMGYPDLVATVWFSLSGPAGLPPEVVSRLNEDVRRALELPEIRERVKHDGVLPNRLDAKAFTAFVADELRRWGPIVRASGAKND